MADDLRERDFNRRAAVARLAGIGKFDENGGGIERKQKSLKAFERGWRGFNGFSRILFLSVSTRLIRVIRVQKIIEKFRMSSQLLFRIISLLGLVGITATIVWAIRSQLIQLAGTKQTLRQQSLDVANNLKQWRSLSTPALLSAMKRFFYLATLGCMLVLALTGFLPVIIFGAAVSNFALMLHLLLAPLFAIGLMALALFWAQPHRFNKNDWASLQQWFRDQKSFASSENPNVWQKICFWLSLLLAVPVIVSTVLMMYPFYGTAGQESLLRWHGYAGLLLLAIAVWHTYLVLADRKK
jgi:cytochrome b561